MAQLYHVTLTEIVRVAGSQYSIRKTGTGPADTGQEPAGTSS